MILKAKGYKFLTRPEQTSDAYVVQEVIEENCYKIKPEYFTGGMIIDIGANIGTFSVLASQYGKVLSYEPEEHNFELLKENTKGYDVEINKLAVGKEGKALIVNVGGSSSTVEWFQQNYAPGKMLTEVKVVNINDIITKSCDFLKIDCEGGEYDIFDTISIKTLKLIKRFAMEFHPYDMEIHNKMIEKLAQYFILKIEGSLIFGEKKC